MKPETMKLLGKKKKKQTKKPDSKLFATIFFFEPVFLGKGNKGKINKWHNIKLQAFAQKKKPSTKRKTNLNEGKKIFTNHMSDKR